MTSLLFSPFAIPICAIVGVFVWKCISAITSSVQQIVQHRNEIELKQLLAERGMSAEEIERVVQATGHKVNSDQDPTVDHHGNRMVG